MKRYTDKIETITWFFVIPAAAIAIAVWFYIVWDVMLGVMGQNFIITIIQLLIPVFVTLGTITALSLGYALWRDNRKGVL